MVHPLRGLHSSPAGSQSDTQRMGSSQHQANTVAIATPVTLGKRWNHFLMSLFGKSANLGPAFCPQRLSASVIEFIFAIPSNLGFRTTGNLHYCAAVSFNSADLLQGGIVRLALLVYIVARQKFSFSRDLNLASPSHLFPSLGNGSHRFGMGMHRLAGSKWVT